MAEPAAQEVPAEVTTEAGAAPAAAASEEPAAAAPEAAAPAPEAMAVDQAPDAGVAVAEEAPQAQGPPAEKAAAGEDVAAAAAQPAAEAAQAQEPAAAAAPPPPPPAPGPAAAPAPPPAPSAAGGLDHDLGALSLGPASSMGAGLTVRGYLDSTVVPVLRLGLRELVKARPADPYQFLADFILANRPSQ